MGHASMSSARSTAAVLGGGAGAFDSCCQVCKSQSITGAAAGQSRSAWLMFSWIPVARHKKWMSDVALCPLPVSLNRLNDGLHSNGDGSSSEGLMTGSGIRAMASYFPDGAQDANSKTCPQVKCWSRRSVSDGPCLDVVCEKHRCRPRRGGRSI